MRYEHLEDLGKLVERKLISERKHPTLPLFIYNYTAGAQSLSIQEWTPALRDCRGLILDESGEVVGRPFAKFWNYEQVLDQIPSDLPYTVWEKLDGSLGIVCSYRGNLVVSTRGSFESEQAKFATEWLNTYAAEGWLPPAGLTYLFEIIYPENRIVVDYGEIRELRLLAVMEEGGWECQAAFYAENRFTKVRCFAPTQVQIIQDSILVQDDPGKEGYVLRWSNGFRAKVKFEEYKRLHRLITQVSTRSIWELLRAGKSTEELIDRVPENFKAWVNDQLDTMLSRHLEIVDIAYGDYATRPRLIIRKEYAEWAKAKTYPSLLFAIEDGKSIMDQVWKMIEPRWSTPFRPGVES